MIADLPPMDVVQTVVEERRADRGIGSGQVFSSGGLFTYYNPALDRYEVVRANASAKRSTHISTADLSTAPTRLVEAIQANDATRLLVELGGPDAPAFERTISQFSPGLTNWVVKRAAEQGESTSPLLSRFKRARLASVARSFEGKFYFAGSATVSVADEDQDGKKDYLPARIYERTADFLFGTFQWLTGTEKNVNDFALWIRSEGPEPGENGKMNCWESILLLAYKAGIVDEPWVRDVYDRAMHDGQDADSQATFFATIGEAIGLDEAREILPRDWPGDEPPQLSESVEAGDIVFFKSVDRYNGMEHVALALGTIDDQGRHEVMSLWQLPEGPFGFDSKLQRTTIEEILSASNRLGAMKFGVKIAPIPF